MNSVHRGSGMTSARTRDRLVQRLQDEGGIRNPAVLDVIRRTPRHIFVDEALASRAYEDTALPIGLGQTLSQPWVVARMTELLLEPGRPARVLEVGTGSGYQAAVLSPLVGEVYTIERIADLLTRARARFRELGLYNIRARHGDGYRGWPEQAPFDRILLTAAPQDIPEALLEQLAPGGRLVAPVGPRDVQDLVVIDHTPDGLQRRVAGRVVFVPLLGGTV